MQVAEELGKGGISCGGDRAIQQYIHRANASLRAIMGGVRASEIKMRRGHATEDDLQHRATATWRVRHRIPNLGLLATDLGFGALSMVQMATSDEVGKGRRVCADWFVSVGY